MKSGDTVEKLAVQEYGSSVRDGHDLRYYENVLLFANKQRRRVGITGTYQIPGCWVVAPTTSSSSRTTASGS